MAEGRVEQNGCLRAQAIYAGERTTTAERQRRTFGNCGRKRRNIGSLPVIDSLRHTGRHAYRVACTWRVTAGSKVAKQLGTSKEEMTKVCFRIHNGRCQLTLPTPPSRHR